MRKEPSEVAGHKSCARSRAQARLAGLQADARRDFSARILEHCLKILCEAPLASAFVYISTEREVDTHRLIDTLHARGVQVLVPFLPDREQMLAVPFPGWAALQRGVLGILSPPRASAWSGDVDLAVVPGLAFGPAGERLGHGAGYYDRWLAANAPRRMIALAFECQIEEGLPMAAHDIRIPVICTESRIINTLREQQSIST